MLFQEKKNRCQERFKLYKMTWSNYMGIFCRMGKKVHVSLFPQRVIVTERCLDVYFLLG